MTKNAGPHSLARLVVILLGCGLAGAPLKASPVLYSASISLEQRRLTWYCGPCSNNTNVQDTAFDAGGPGATSATGLVDAGDLGQGRAEAVLVGENQLPQLRAYASSGLRAEQFQPIIAEDTNASAYGVNLYRFIGTTLATYAITYTIDGTVAGGNRDGGLTFQSVGGGVFVYDGIYDPSREINPLRGEDQQAISGNGTFSPFHIEGTIYLYDIHPGDSFSVSAFLAASSSTFDLTLPGAVDAWNTMHVSFTQGDTSLLIPASTAAPEPGTVLLAAVGLAVLHCIAKQARRRGGFHATARRG
jgi:hypothetical protein